MARFNSAGWLDIAIRRPGPAIKTSGFRRVTTGAVYHSAVGYEAGMMAVLDNVRVQSSWALSNMQDGRVLQHYPIDIVTWASNQMNPKTAAMEHEGGHNPHNETLTAPQIDNGVLVAQALRDRYAWSKFARTGPQKNLWEHREIVNTACPSGRIDPIWGVLLSTEPPAPPPLEKEDDMAVIILNTNENPGKYYLSTWMSKRHLKNMAELNWYRALRVAEAQIAQSLLDEIPYEYEGG